VTGCALAGLLMATYLSLVSLSQRGVPLGCGAGSGCDEVFRSRWSAVAGVPVGIVAGSAYLGVLLGAALLRRGRGPSLQRLAWFGLAALAGGVAAAAVWFVGLQLIVLRAVCPWCVAEHVIGLLLSGLVAFGWKRATRAAASRGDKQPIPMKRGVCLGVLGVVILAAAQMLTGGDSPTIARLPGDRNADTGPGPDRQVAVLNGRLSVDVHRLPHLGNPDAPHVLVLLFDYCCPHCRATHGFLAEGLARYPDQYVIVLLPMPLDAECNPFLFETEPRFAEACELAHLALSLWRVDPAVYESFDRWLFEPERPRTFSESLQHAATLVDETALQSALADPAAAAQIEVDITAYANSGAQTIPVLLSPDMDGVVGRTETADELFAILEKELGLKPAP